MHIIAGLYRNRKLITPIRTKTRPTASHLREALFNICQTDIEGARFLDICAGSGGIGLEALSRGASFSTFIEHHRDAVNCIRQNIQSLNVQDHTQIFHGDIFKMLDFLKRKGETFDIIYADPPYHTKELAATNSESITEKLIKCIDESTLLGENGILFIEESFAYSPSIMDLTTLSLKKSRRIGAAVLQQYGR